MYTEQQILENTYLRDTAMSDDSWQLFLSAFPEEFVVCGCVRADKLTEEMRNRIEKSRKR